MSRLMCGRPSHHTLPSPQGHDEETGVRSGCVGNDADCASNSRFGKRAASCRCFARRLSLQSYSSAALVAAESETETARRQQKGNRSYLYTDLRHLVAAVDVRREGVQS